MAFINWFAIMASAIDICWGISFNQPKFSSCALWNINATTFANESSIGQQPTGLFVNTNYNIYVSDRQNNHILIWYNGSLPINQIISANLISPWSIFVTDTGDIFVDNEHINGRVDKWTLNGTNSEPVMYVNSSCTGLFIDITNSLYCSLVNEHRVFKLELNNNTTIPMVVAGTGCPGPVVNMLDHPHGIFVDENLNLFVADSHNNRIQRFETGQMNAMTVAGFGAFVTFILDRPTSVVLDADGYLFIVDSGNDRIIRSVSNGFQCLFGCSDDSGASASQLNNPQTMAFDKDGNIFVTDLNNHRIQKFILAQNSCATTAVTTSTTTTTLFLDFSCVNQTWNSSANRIAQWLFDGNYRDQMNNYNTTPTNTMSFTTNGYVKEAIMFSPNAKTMLTAPYIPLLSTSFTIDVWLYITGLQNIDHHGIFSLCTQVANYKCLHVTIRQDNSNYYLYLGFYSADCQGVTSLTLNTWIHAAFVFDITTLTQKIYLNGVLENSCTQSTAVTATTTSITIGYVPVMGVYGRLTYFQGYIDQMTVSNRAKSSCEILEIATLVAHFTFDTGSFLNDSGPNSLEATTQSTSSVSSGRFSQAITFNGSASSYYQMNGFTALGISNKSFSISLWIRPTTLLGTVLHVSTRPMGAGWCMPFLGFALNGSLVAQMYNSEISHSSVSLISVADPTFSVSTLVWSHVVQTWSSTNGMRLYINNVVVASRLSSATLYGASSQSNFLTLANSLNGPTHCVIGDVNSLPYKGDMDDFRAYSRELSGVDIYTLYTT